LSVVGNPRSLRPIIEASEKVAAAEMRDRQKHLSAFFVFVTRTSLVLGLASGCGSAGWLPSMSLAVAGIDRVEQKTEQDAKRKMVFHAEGRLIWKINTAYYNRYDKRFDDRFSAISDLDYRMCRGNALCEWEITERTRLINETTIGLYP
jgi:hypothetical protein